MYLRANEVYPISGKTHVKVRFGVESLDCSVKCFVDSLPRSYAVELGYHF